MVGWPDRKRNRLFSRSSFRAGCLLVSGMGGVVLRRDSSTYESRAL